ncbi:MAG: hypothetical protein KDC27_21585 [Acidobacteria bacterium]|nr:hypothetical protein [Acidobacteriota bacterium]
MSRTAALVFAFAGSLLAQQQGPGPRRLAEMTVSLAEVRIGADEGGRSALCRKLEKLRADGFPVTPAAPGAALTVACEGRRARVFPLRLSAAAKDPKRALCEYAAAPVGLAFDGIDFLTLHQGGPAVSGEDLRARLEPLGVRTYAALLFAFGFERIEAGGDTSLSAPLHQIDGYCAGG